MERVFSIVKDCTFPQLWNSAEYGISKFRGFPSTYLKYNPPGLFLFITSRCNRNCKFCGYHSPNRPSNYRLDFPDMSMDAFKWIINRFSHAVDIEFGGGGEPFLHSHIFEMIDYAQEHGILSMIPTNGTFLHDVLDRVVRFPLLLLNISLNACDSGEFFQLLGGSKKTYNTLLEDISQLVKMRKRYNKGLKIAISYVCTKANYRNIPKMVELAEDLGVNEIDFRNLISFDIPGFSKEQCLYVDDAEVIDVINSVPSPKSNLKVIMPRLYKREYLRRRCYVPFRIVTMDAEGNVSPCPSIPPRRDYGNVFADDDVWNNSAFRMRRGIFTNQSLLLPDFCKTCPGLVTKWRPAYISRKRAVR